MSYNGYNNYNYQPYYNHRTSESRHQFTYQYPASQNSYQYPNANGQQQPHSVAQPPSSSAHNDTSSYNGAKSSGTGTGTGPGPEANQRFRADNSYNGGRSSDNISALGNLAYASSLRQDANESNQERKSLERAVDRNHGTPTNNFTAHQRPDGRDTEIHISSRSSAINSRTNSQYQSQYSYEMQQNDQISVQSFSNPTGGTTSTSSDLRNTYIPPSRPSSGQMVRVPHSQLKPASHQSSRQTSTSGQQSPNLYQPQPQPQSDMAYQSSHSASTSRYDTGQGGAQVHRPSWTSKPQNSSPTPTFSTNGSSNLHQHLTHSRSQLDNQQNTSRSAAAQSLPLPSRDSTIVTQITNGTTSANEDTIDPNKVFNEYEYQKRQAAIAAEAKAEKEKAVYEAETQRRQAVQRTATQVSSMSTLQINDESIMKTQMEAEMKLMLEKMRDYKSKDPTLFSQIWEQVKKAQPPSSALPASKEVAVATITPRDSITSQPPNESAQIPTSAAIDSPQIHPDPNSQLIEKSTSPAPAIKELDRGKYPAARRRGKLYKARSSLEQSHQAVDPSPISGPPAGYVRAEDADTALNQPVQKVWVSGKGNMRGSTYDAKSHAAQDKSPSSSAPANNEPSIATQPVQASKPAPRPTGQTLWPEEDKWALAIAARNTLLGHPANRGKSILSSDIRNLLDQGPSYEELCIILEGKGFVVERTPFAQQLLAAVPRLKNQRPEQTTQSATRLMHESTDTGSIHDRNTRGEGVLVAAANEIDGGQSVFVPVAHMYNHPEKVPTQSSSFMVPSKKARPTSRIGPASAQLALTPQPIFTKQLNAKKRDFNEIVDLTAEMDSDEELERQRAEKLRKFEKWKSKFSKSNGQNEISTSAASSRTMDKPLAKGPRPSSSSGDVQSSAVQSDEDVNNISRFQNVASPQRERLRKARVVKSMNRESALRRSTYNSETIARDILITAGKHSVMPSLNYHLDGLKSRFRHVDHSSDLSTFDWSLVDPGGPPPKRPSEDSGSQDAADAIVALPAFSSRREVRIAIPIDDGRDDNVVSQPALVGPRKGVFSKRRSLGSVSFISPQFSSATGQSLGQPLAPFNRENDDVSMLGAGQSTSSMSTSKRPGMDHLSATPQSSLTAKIRSVTGSGESSSEPRRRGRPPGAKNKGPRRSSTHLPSNMSVPNRPHPDTALNPRLEPMSTNINTESTKSVSTTPAKPSSLRNEVMTSPTAGFAVVVPSPNRASHTSRPVNQGSITKIQPAPIPKHQVYKCRWESCLAELHNLETLRKHVHKHMDEFNENFDYECLWTGCGSSSIDLDAQRKPLRFKSAISWERHMDGRHLDHYAWDLGDGPSPHPSG